MASVQYGSIVTEIAGSVRGHTFQRNSVTTILRTRSRVTRATTIKQGKVHNRLNRIQSLWATLSYAQKLAWNQFASEHPEENRLGQRVMLTGLNWFFRCNTLYVAGYGNAILDPPNFLPPPALDKPTFVPDDRTLVIRLSTTYDTRAYPIEVMATYPLMRVTTTVKIS